MCIEEGDVTRVGCPDPECVKKGNEAGEEEVARVVTEAELQRWKWLKEKRNLERGVSYYALCFLPASNKVWQTQPLCIAPWRYAKRQSRNLATPRGKQAGAGSDSARNADSPSVPSAGEHGEPKQIDPSWLPS